MEHNLKMDSSALTAALAEIALKAHELQEALEPLCEIDIGCDLEGHGRQVYQKFEELMLSMRRIIKKDREKKKKAKIGPPCSFCENVYVEHDCPRYWV